MEFDRVVQAIALHPQESDLSGLLRVFDDRTEHSEVMWTLVHLVEGYDAATYAATFVDLLPDTMPVAPDWMEVLAIGQLNHDEARGLLVQAARRAKPAAGRAIADVLGHISRREDTVAIRADEVMSALGLA